MRVVMVAAQRTPLLLECSPISVARCWMEAGIMGLECNTPLAEAYLIPFKNKGGGYDCQLIAGYQGLMKLARNSGEVTHFEADVVYSKDEFHYERGLDPKLKHIPSEEEDRGEIRGAYAIANLTNGRRVFEYMSKGEIDKHRARSKARDSGPWVTDYGPMCIKTVIKKCCKLIPRSPELARLISNDEYAEMGQKQDLPNLPDVFAIDVASEDVEETPEPGSNG